MIHNLSDRWADLSLFLITAALTTACGGGDPNAALPGGIAPSQTAQILEQSQLRGVRATPLQTFVNPSPELDDNFGNAVAIFNDQLLVGDRFDNTSATSSGSVYLFHATGGDLIQTLTNPTPAIGDNFGHAVALSDQKALIGAIYDDTQISNAGAAYLFNPTTNTLITSLYHPEPAPHDLFGWSVALRGPKALVGAPFDDRGTRTDAGSVHLYAAPTGELVQSFEAVFPQSGSEFGHSIALSATQVLIGAPFEDLGEFQNAGTAYLFTLDGTLVQQFYAPTLESFDTFGSAVALSADRVLIGSPLEDAARAANAGAAYLFDAASGELLQTFSQPLPRGGEQFGAAVALTSDQVMIGNDLEPETAYVYDANTGRLQQILSMSDIPRQSDYYGISLSAAGDRFAVGVGDRRAARVW